MEYKEIGVRIRQVRNKCGYTQERLAEMADIGAVYLGEIERGKKMPSLKSFIKILKALDISADYVLRNELSSGKEFIFDEVTKKLENLTPHRRKALCDIIDAYIQNIE